MTEWIIIYNKNISLYMGIINSYIFSQKSSRHLSVGESLEKLNFKLPSGLKKKEYLQQGLFPVIDQGKISKGGFTNNNNLVIDQQLPMIIFGDHTRMIKYIDKPFAIGADGVKLLKPKNYFVEKYYYYSLKGLNIGNRGYGRHFKIINSKKISIPFFENKTKSIEFQNAVVAFMEDFRNNNLKNKIYFCLDIENKIKNIQCESLKINNYLGLNIDQKNILQKLRQAILQDAISGKLTVNWRKKNPNVETASELLKKIKAEKEKLVAEKKIKKEKPLPEISKEEIPFELPNGWEWCRLGDFCNLITDGTHHTPHYVKEGIHFLSVRDVAHGSMDFSNTKFISRLEHENLIKRCHPEFGDVLLTKVGTTGIAKVVDVNKEFSIFVSVALLKFNQNLLFNYFLENLINSPIVKKQSEAGTKGMGNKNLVLRVIKDFIVPLPPLYEQKAIVEKIETLMQKLDKLEVEISQNQKTADMLMQVVLKEAFEGK